LNNLPCLKFSIISSKHTLNSSKFIELIEKIV